MSAKRKAYNSILYLLSEVKTVNEYGDTVTEQVRKRRWCCVSSVKRSEFYQAQANGFKPEIAFELPDARLYSGELNIEYNGKLFHVLRSYQEKDSIQLNCYSEVI